MSIDAALDVFQKAAEGATFSDRSKAYLAAQHAKLVYGASGDIDGARELFKAAIAKYSESRFLWMSYVIFEVSQPGARCILYDDLENHHIIQDL